MFKISAILTSAAILCTGTLFAATPAASAACVEPTQTCAPFTAERCPCICICGDWQGCSLPDWPAICPNLPPVTQEPSSPPAEEVPPQDEPSEEKPSEEKPSEENPSEETPETGEEETVQSEAEAVAALVNEARQSAGLTALQLDETLCAAAQARAEEIAQSFSHTRPDGTSCFTILKEFGISYRAVGENIAKGSQTPEAVMDGWMHSEGHRANILNDAFTSIGVGYYVDGAGVAHWVQIFCA